jgi:aminomethyltransferase
MKNTALTHIHEGLGAKMFAGYNMPILYEGVNAEHETVRNAVGVLMFHMGNSLFRPNALALIQKVTLMMPQH